MRAGYHGAEEASVEFWEVLGEKGDVRLGDERGRRGLGLLGILWGGDYGFLEEVGRIW